MTDEKNKLIPTILSERIINKIFLVRDKKVMLDADLAELYGVETGALNRAVKRNIDRFPEDFMFQLTREEFNSLKCQIGISKKGRGGRRYTPLVFTEHGILMLSSALNSKRAIQVNIQIMRTFTKLREMLASHADLKKKIEAMERKYDKQFKAVFDVIKQLLELPKEPKGKISNVRLGFCK